MKVMLLATLCFSSFLVCAQKNMDDSPFYEQIALDVYQKEIIKEFPIAKRIYAPEFVFNGRPNQFYISSPCYSNGTESIYSDKLISLRDSIAITVEFLATHSLFDYAGFQKKQIRIRNNIENRYPKILISEPYYNSNWPTYLC